MNAEQHAREKGLCVVTCRGAFIDLTHRLPEPAPRKVLDLWARADLALSEFIIALQELEQ